jgi:hypothetical protein
MERIILYPNTPEFELFEKLKPIIKQAIFDAYSNGYFLGELDAIKLKTKEPSSRETINEITEKAINGEGMFDIDSPSVRYLTFED